MDDWYTAAELRAIDTAGRITRAGLQALRARDDRPREWREPYVSWDSVSAGQSPEYTDERK